MKVERKRKYKKLRQLFKARDMARKYLKCTIPVSKLDEFFSQEEVNCRTVSWLAKDIVDYKNKILGLAKPMPPLPPVRKNTCFAYLQAVSTATYLPAFAIDPGLDIFPITP